MSTCANCKSKLGCSCQKRVASDGKSCCTKCLQAYEKQINQNKTKK